MTTRSVFVKPLSHIRDIFKGLGKHGPFPSCYECEKYISSSEEILRASNRIKYDEKEFVCDECYAEKKLEGICD